MKSIRIQKKLGNFQNSQELSQGNGDLGKSIKNSRKEFQGR